MSKTIERYCECGIVLTSDASMCINCFFMGCTEAMHEQMECFVFQEDEKNLYAMDWEKKPTVNLTAPDGGFNNIIIRPNLPGRKRNEPEGE